MSPESRRSAAVPVCFPRVSGDEPVGGSVWVSVEEFSPRERG